MNLKRKFPKKLLFKVALCFYIFYFININAINAKTFSTSFNTENLAREDWINNPLEKCGGYFENPIKEYKDFDFKNRNLEANADKSTLEEEKLIFNGNVNINNGDINARSEVAYYDPSKEILRLNKNIIIRTPQVGIGGDNAEINLTSQEADISKANYVFHSYHAHGEAKKIKINQKNNITVISNGNYSYCPPDDRFWEMHASEIKLDNNISQGIAKKVILKIKSIPVLFIPYVQFPIGNERQSGFLSPILSKNSKGIDFSLPYYFNIASNFDVVFSPRYNSNYGLMTEANARALTRFENWQIDSTYLHNNLSDQRFSNKERWLLRLKENGNWSKNLYSKIDFTRVSDINYFQDLNSQNLTINRKSHLNQNASINYYNDNLAAGISIQHYQYLLNLNSHQKIEKLPSWFLKYESNRLYFKPDYKFEIRQANFSKEFEPDTLRNFGEISFNFPMRWRGIELKPNIGLEYLSYEVDSSPSNNNQKIKRSITSTKNQLEVNLAFIKDAINPNLIDIKLSYMNRKSNRKNIIDEYFDSEWLNFNDNYFSDQVPFSGYDIHLDSHYISALISHSLLDSYGNKKIITKIGQIHYFSDRDENDENPSWIKNEENRSPIYAEFEMARAGNWKAFASSSINERNSKIDEGHLILNYKNDKSKPMIFNIGYHYRNIIEEKNSYNPKINQTDLSLIKPLNSKWSIMGRYSYDNELKRDNELLSGVSYNSCCYSISIIYRDTILKSFSGGLPSRDKSIYLKFDLKGLFGVGGKMNKIINRSIEGFDEDNQEYF